MDIPETIFLIPYRDREQHKIDFEKAMKINLLNMNSYKIYFVHQCDKRPFNRGAIKNIGFLAIKNLYPNNYKDITFIFHDIDVWGKYPNTIEYITEKNKVKHYYGYKFALGGIFAIKGEDFELVKGFPNFWGWGFEDNTIYNKCVKNNLIIDRSNFYDIGNKNIIHLFDDYKKIYSKRELCIFNYETPDTIDNLYDYSYKIEDNMINVYTFSCLLNDNNNDHNYAEHDIRNGNLINIDKKNIRRVWNMNSMYSYN